MIPIVAFLRGINLGKRRIRMDDLRQCLDKAGLENIRTYLASGNVLFDGTPDSQTARTIEAALENTFGFPVETILRARHELAEMVASRPFGDRRSGDDMKCYVYFLAEPETGKLNCPRKVDGDYEIVKIAEREIFAIGHRLPDGRFGSGLDALTKPFGRHITNRNWNTVEKLADM